MLEVLKNLFLDLNEVMFYNTLGARNLCFKEFFCQLNVKSSSQNVYHFKHCFKHSQKSKNPSLQCVAPQMQVTKDFKPNHLQGREE